MAIRGNPLRQMIRRDYLIVGAGIGGVSVCEGIREHDKKGTILLAGHETTANALTWIFYLLSQHPEVEHLLLEEIDTLLPVLKQLRSEGMDLVGPLPADTAFLPQALANFDVVLAMYHDQGLPVLKHAGFEQAVNITLGLPYPSVAVDHGTALEIAGKGIADPSSLFAAVELCTRLARHRMRA